MTKQSLGDGADGLEIAKTASELATADSINYYKLAVESGMAPDHAAQVAMTVYREALSVYVFSATPRPSPIPLVGAALPPPPNKGGIN